MKNLAYKVLALSLLSLPAQAQEAQLTGGLENCNGVSSMKAIQYIDKVISGLNKKGEQIMELAEQAKGQLMSGNPAGQQKICAKMKSSTNEYQKEAQKMSNFIKENNVIAALQAAGENACANEILESKGTFHSNLWYLQGEAYTDACQSSGGGNNSGGNNGGNADGGDGGAGR